MITSIALIILTSVGLPLWAVYFSWEGAVLGYRWLISTELYAEHVESALSYVGISLPTHISSLDPHWVVQATYWIIVPLAIGILGLNALMPMKRRIASASGFIPERLKSSDDLPAFVRERLSAKGDPKVRMWVIADDQINAFALSGPFGGNAIVVSTGLLISRPAEVVQWVVAHEYAHIIHKDTRGTALWLVTMRCVDWFTWMRLKMTNTLLLVVFNLPLISFLATPLYLALWLLSVCTHYGRIVGCWTFLLFDRWASRKQEYAADRYAAAVCGPRPGIFFFSSLDGAFENRFNSIFATHPTHIQRIRALEAYEIITRIN